MKSWEWVRLVRNVDKVASRIPAPAASLLLVLADHADEYGKVLEHQEALVHETGIPRRSLQRAQDKLVELGVMIVETGRQHAPNTYALSSATLAQLPRIQRRQHGAAEDASSAKPTPPAAPNERPSSAKTDVQQRHGGAQREERDQKREEERAAPAASLTVEEGFAIADEVAARAGHSAPSRTNPKNEQAMKELVIDAVKVAKARRGMTAAETLRDRLARHHASNDDFVVRNHYALSLAKQVDAAPPVKPEYHKKWVDPDAQRLAKRPAQAFEPKGAA